MLELSAGAGGGWGGGGQRDRRAHKRWTKADSQAFMTIVSASISELDAEEKTDVVVGKQPRHLLRALTSDRGLEG